VRPALLLLLVGLLAAGCLHAEPEAVEPEEAEPEAVETVAQDRTDVFGAIPEIVRELEPSVVSVLVGQGVGSGVVWDAEGLIVTNHHVVAGGGPIEVALATGERMPAELVASDPRTDVAVIRVERTGLPAAEFADALPEVGSLAIAMGSPLGFENSVTAGIVSGLGRALPPDATQPAALVDLIQTDAAISPGNSGGALVSVDGRVMGINVAYIPPQARAVAIGFAIPATTVVAVVAQLLETGAVQHAYLGVAGRAVTPALADQFGLGVEQGVLVLEVPPGSPAEEADLRAGDVVVELSGEELARVEDLIAVLRRHAPGDEVEVVLVREGERLELEIVLAERPD
jgi:serine protease DegQ